MAILLDCTCGKKLQARDELLGKRVKCPGCGGIVLVERILDAIPVSPEIDEQTAFEPIDAAPRPTPSALPPELDDDEGIPDRGKRWRRKVSKAPVNFWATGPGQVSGGLLLILGAIVWFGVGLLLDRIFFYPLFLMIGGAFGAVKGLIECAKPKPAFAEDEDDD